MVELKILGEKRIFILSLVPVLIYLNSITGIIIIIITIIIIIIVIIIKLLLSLSLSYIFLSENAATPGERLA